MAQVFFVDGVGDTRTWMAPRSKPLTLHNHSQSWLWAGQHALPTSPDGKSPPRVP